MTTEPQSADEFYVRLIAAFGQALHSAGLPVTPERSVRFARVIELARPTTVDELYWLGRVTLISTHDQVETYDRIFREVFESIIYLEHFEGQSLHRPPPSSAPSGERSPKASERAGESSNAGNRPTSATPGRSVGEDQESDDPALLAAASEQERLNSRDFAACTPEELELLSRLAAQFPVVPPPRRGRRLRRHVSGTRMDVRSTLRRSHRTAGDPVEFVMRRRTERPRRVVLLADVSGSMEPYARVYLHLMRGAVRAIGAEAFVFATRLTRVTRPLGVMQPDVAYTRAVKAANDWSGGTRIGAALQTFLDDYGRRGMARGAVVVIVSDGWEIEGPELIETSMQRLSRLAHHVIWVNPRKAAESYEPLVGGMAAALPYVDTFVSGHSLRALEDVMAAISSATERTPAASVRHRVPA